MTDDDHVKGAIKDMVEASDLSSLKFGDVLSMLENICRTPTIMCPTPCTAVCNHMRVSLYCGEPSWAEYRLKSPEEWDRQVEQILNDLLMKDGVRISRREPSICFFGSSFQRKAIRETSLRFRAQAPEAEPQVQSAGARFQYHPTCRGTAGVATRHARRS